jgi:ABC-type polysaccharide/polyol phosphate transport system ATPase subunit
MIEFKHVSKEYALDGYKSDSLKDVFSFRKKVKSGNRYRAVDDVSFLAAEGAALGILGRNGAGKSTLLKLLTRIILPDQGKISVQGSISCLLEVGAGFHHDLSGFENIYLSGAILGMNRHEVNRKIGQIIDYSEIGNFIYEPVKHYSSGMYLRLAFSIGIHLDSDILVIDEALAVGDSLFQKKCIDTIKEIKQKGRTIVFVSHDIHQITQICDTAIVMNQGKMIFNGSATDAVAIYENLS